MLHKIENDKLSVTVSDHGAELCSIYDKENQREILWQADPAYWSRHAPILFPNVGKFYQLQYRVHNKAYTIGQHGFARDMEFICTAYSENTVTHELSSTVETLEKYPFSFKLEITHTIESGTLEIIWKVSNTGADDMYFTIGGHPAFQIPLIPDTEYNQYSLYFKDTSALTYHLLDAKTGTLLTDTDYKMPLENGQYPLSKEMFKNDALVFDGGQISCVGLMLPDKTPFLEMKAEGFPNFGIWAAPDAPFVCLEPWMGRCDDYGFTGELKEKENINQLSADEVFTKNYFITIF